MGSRDPGPPIPAGGVRGVLRDAGAILLLSVALAAGGAAFAVPWLSQPPGGALLARYAPLADGDAALVERRDTSGAVTAWESQTAAIVPSLRTFTDLRPALRDAIDRFYQGTTGSTSTSDDLAPWFDTVQIVDLRVRTLAPPGDVGASEIVSLREPRGDFLVGYVDPATDQDLTLDPPALLLPAELRLGASWETEGHMGSIAYRYSGRVVEAGPVAGSITGVDDCLVVESQFTLGAADAGGTTTGSRVHYCSGLGAIRYESFDELRVPQGEATIVSTTRSSSTSRAALTPPPPLIPAATNASDPAGWQLTRVGRSRPVGEDAAGTFPPVWVPADPPIVLAAAEGGEVLAFPADGSGDEALWAFNPAGTVYGTPAVDPKRGRIFFGASDKRLYALDVRGLFLWSMTTGDNVAGRPALVADTVIFGSEDRNIYGVDAETGIVRWRRSTGAAVVASPAVAGTLVVAGSDDGGVYAFDPVTGEERWQVMGSSPIEAPIVSDGGFVFVADIGGGLTALHAADGTVAWRADLPGAIRSAPALAAQSVYVVTETGQIVAVDRATGEIVWTTEDDETYVGPPVLVGTSLLAATADGAILRLDPSGNRLEEWQASAASGLLDSPPTFSLGLSLGGDSAWLADNTSVVRRLGPSPVAASIQDHRHAAPREVAAVAPVIAPLASEVSTSRTAKRAVHALQQSQPLFPAWFKTVQDSPFGDGDLSYSAAEYDGKALLVDSMATVYLSDPATGETERLGRVRDAAQHPYVGPVVSDSTLVTVSGTTLTAAALPDLRPLWQFSDPGVALRPPVVAGEIVLWLTFHIVEPVPPEGLTGTLHALDLTTGDVRWQARLDGIAGAGDAVVRDDVVYIGTPPTAFDRLSGELIWQTPSTALEMGGIALSDDGATLFVAAVPDLNSADTFLLAIDTADGGEEWRATLPNVSLQANDRLWTSGNTLIFPSSERTVLGLSTSDGSERWRYEQSSTRLGTVSVVDGHLWIALQNSRVEVLEAATGRLIAEFTGIDLDLIDYNFAQRPVLIAGKVLVAMGLVLIAFTQPSSTV